MAAKKGKKGSKVEATGKQMNEAADAFVKAMWDVRMFGAVHPQFTGGRQRSTGAIQLSPAISLQPIQVTSHGLTRCAGAGEKKSKTLVEAAAEEAAVIDVDAGPEDLRANMGRKSFVEHAAYEFSGSYTPKHGRALHVTREDLQAFFDGLTNGWANSRASNRTGVNLRTLIAVGFDGERGPNEMKLKSAIMTKMPRKAPDGVAPWDTVEVTVDHELIHKLGGKVAIWRDGDLDGELPVDPNCRWVIMGIIECVMSNPNGDPDKNGDPRQLSNGFGYISAESIKRVIRDFVADEYECDPRMNLFVARGTNMTTTQQQFIQTAVGGDVTLPQVDAEQATAE